ncbi:heterokaryon incompatibility protein-domain-containing protein [Paraphoma chrysanthemicola]|nr:heterokaryon incompatibility protein-domain-containing protein [Paraphoma chrysanthemicola]
MAPKLAPFVYTRLEPGQIRVLNFSTQSDGTVDYHLSTVQFLDLAGSPTPLEFDALSYTWGDLSTTYPIVCNEQQLHVHHNLLVALPHLARRSSNLPIWIDAVCINQADAAEKMQQIRMMIRIYRWASNVWVWLGSGNQQSGNVISNLHQLVDRKTDVLTMMTKMPETLPWLTTKEAWSTITSLTGNEWYRRLWVVQEASYARHLRMLLGQHEIDWDILQQLIRSEVSGWHITGPDGSTAPNTSKWSRGLVLSRHLTQKAYNAGRSLTATEVANIVTYTMHALCRDPRDRVYALLGFVAVEVDETTPLEDMYIQLARSVLLNTSLDPGRWWRFLRSATSVGKRTSLPSWCPDFHDYSGRPSSEQKFRRYSASTRKNEAKRPYDLHSKELVLRGQIFDGVETTFMSLPEHEHAEDSDLTNLQSFHNWEQATETAIYIERDTRLRTYSPVFASEAAMAAAYWETLNSNFARNPQEWPMSYESLTSFKEGLAGNSHDLETLRLLDEVAFALETNLETAPEIMRHFAAIASIYVTMEGQRLFMTANGRLGRGSSSIEPGDSVCIFSSALTAHILRRSPNTTEETYTLIGEAYVHGMMHGEIEDLDIEEQDVVLV